MAEPLVVDPFLPQTEVEHREGGVSSHLLVNIQELREPLVELLVGESGVGLQQHQAAAPRVARLPVPAENI